MYLVGWIQYGYKAKDGNIMDADGNTYISLATIHTHYSTGVDPQPSGINWGEGDLETFAQKTPNKPILTMGNDGKIYGVLGNYGNDGKLKWGWLPSNGKIKIKDILNGKSLIPVISGLSFKK